MELLCLKIIVTQFKLGKNVVRSLLKENNKELEKKFFKKLDVFYLSGEGQGNKIFSLKMSLLSFQQ